MGDELLFETASHFELDQPRTTSAFTVTCESTLCCLLQISMGELMDMSEANRLKARVGGGESFKKDFNTLMSLLRQCYDEKV